MNNILISERELRLLIEGAVKAGVNLALTELGMVKAYLSKAEAYKVYGRKQVDRWISEKLIDPIKDGTNTSKIRLSRIELESISLTSNRMSWYRTYQTDK